MVTQRISSEVLSASGVKFGTSGARGLVTQFTSDVCAAFTHAFVVSMRESFTFTQVAVAIDNRPSSLAMAQAIIQALTDAGIEPVYYGVVPTPALAYTSMQDGMPCIMVTGSHIPFDRNGIKFYRPDGEITKADEQAILTEKVYFRAINKLPELTIDLRAAELYRERYVDLFDGDFLADKRIGIYEHSCAGRDIYQGLFKSLGAEVISLERTDEFVPIDTEAVAESDKEKARLWSKQYNLDFIFSTDGDGDRPLVANENGEWLRGDILGFLCSKALQVDALAIPVNCNTIIAESSEFKAVSKTRIGSPYVIAEFPELAETYQRIAGFEANGGYMLGSDIPVNGKLLKALPTRDAILPALMLLFLAKTSSIKNLVSSLPQRFTHSDRIKNFATEQGLSILESGRQDTKQLLEALDLSEFNVISVDSTDGLRLELSNCTVIHLRPSGNAPEMRCYAEADRMEDAVALVEKVLEGIRLI
ncbi:phosphomannomutase [Vibrio hepatarius]|uniref:phosphomannomutase n=1 Tax=Vibrio hepatarius TaxID=171383 RepID=UPI001C0A1DBC|nr:phosphomannomutase [Vibrio hepatarius]MBU2896887.1 phosphomannomutase [Vibrio hepatarius]